jgi:thioredoxin-related protein
MKSYITAFLIFSFSFVCYAQVIADGRNDNRHTDEDGLPPVEIEAVQDLSSLESQARQSQKIIMLEVTASYCSYCDLLNEEIIKPMIRSGDYKNSVLIRQLALDSSRTIKDFAGNETTPARLAQYYKVRITPTLLFLDANGNEVSKRIPGVYSLDFFGAYVDEALAKGLAVIRKN